MPERNLERKKGLRPRAKGQGRAEAEGEAEAQFQGLLGVRERNLGRIRERE